VISCEAGALTPVGVGSSDLFGQMCFGVRLAMFLRTLGTPFLADNPRLDRAFTILLRITSAHLHRSVFSIFCFFGSPKTCPLVGPMSPTSDSPPHTCGGTTFGARCQRLEHSCLPAASPSRAPASLQRQWPDQLLFECRLIGRRARPVTKPPPPLSFPGQTKKPNV
jgi:hypothetical protein